MANESTTQDSEGDGQVLADLLDDLRENVKGNEVSVGDIVDAFDDRSFGVLCTIIGIIAAAPVIGAIPGVSIVMASLVILIASQYLFGRDTPWIPQFLRSRSISRSKLEDGIEKVMPWAKWVDRFVYPRMDWLVAHRHARITIAITMCILAFVMFPLAFIPWGVEAPAIAILLLGIAMMGRDGVFAAIGYSLAGVTIVLLYYSWGVVTAILA
jgi:hypothetical protein